MGIVEFFVVTVIVVFLCWLAVTAANYLAPGHPAIVDKLLWAVGILVIVVLFLRATGLMDYDVRIPHV